MHLAVETKKNLTGFYKIDGRHLKKFIKKVEKDIKNVKEIWKYDYLEKIGNIGFYKNSKVIKIYN